MPWKETRASDERLKFIAEVLSGDAPMADLCHRFGISLSRRPHSIRVQCPNQQRRPVPYVQPLVPATRPNQVCCMDFKGSFECGNGERCDTFTVTDAFSRFVLYCQAIDNLDHEELDRICDGLMKKYGVPELIRTDNGTPFSSISGLGISKLSVKWMRLGILHERIEPGRPTQRMGSTRECIEP